ncbi:MAG TPA: transglutaminaseTgpA domain-containing protein [Acidimicrobiales bacterium]|nr:transglutaminaseTgpA domain-containing protein [Acidimicrobiales bacterium]
MTDVLDPAVAEDPQVVLPETKDPSFTSQVPENGPQTEPVEPPIAFGAAVRALLIAALSTLGAAFMTGGIFGSWSARILAGVFAVVGTAWAFFTHRAKSRLAFQVALIPVAFLLGAIALVPTREGPTGVFKLMTDAISAGRLLRPPVPFDAGWRPIMAVVFMTTGFGAAWLALALKKPQMGLLLPVPILLLTAISQPSESEVLGAVLGFMPVLLALGVLFGGDMDRTSELGSEFELKRLLRALPMVAGGLALLLIVSQTDFLFPKPVYDPTDKPQKPKSIPLGEVEDRVLFEVESDITGPWRLGVLDVYDGTSWRLPPFDQDRFDKVPSGGVVDPQRRGEVRAVFTVRDIGDSSVLPGVADPVSIKTTQGGLLYDPRTGTFRMRTGRVPRDLSYIQALPTYPKPEELTQRGPTRTAAREFTQIPKAPARIQALLDEAPQNPWLRLDFLRKRLNKDVVAVGAGNPSQPVPPRTVDNLLFGTHEGSPYEIVAAETMLARWAGWPARIGFGFDGVNIEGDKHTVRPRNGSNWLEIMVQGRGWQPIIGAPPKAKASLDTDPNSRFDETIQPSDDVAVELLIPVKVESLRLLYENVRAALIAALPFVLALVALYAATPAIKRAWRRRKRRRWAQAEGPRAQVVVEYAELRDSLYDLNVGDPYDTPLEYLERCTPDAEHAELAWLVTRATYGDLAFELDDTHVEAAADLAASVRRRMFAAQPMQSRVLAGLSRESLRRPYTTEVPTVRLLRLRAPWRPRRRLALVPVGNR